MLTTEELQELRALCAKATPGPWDTFPAEHDFNYHGRDKDGQLSAQIMMGEEGGVFAECTFSWDAIFIAHARTALPALLDHIAELDAELSRAKASGIEAMRRAEDAEKDRAARVDPVMEWFLRYGRQPSKDLALLPCPSCGAAATASSCEDKDKVACTECPLKMTGAKGAMEDLVARWNALPRALTWGSDPLTSGWNWWRLNEGDTPICRYVRSDGTTDYATVCRIVWRGLGGQWCPIPMPKEPS